VRHNIVWKNVILQSIQDHDTLPFAIEASSIKILDCSSYMYQLLWEHVDAGNPTGNSGVVPTIYLALSRERIGPLGMTLALFSHAHGFKSGSCVVSAGPITSSGCSINGRAESTWYIVRFECTVDVARTRMHVLLLLGYTRGHGRPTLIPPIRYQ